MIVEAPLPLAAFANGSKLEDVHDVLAQAYKGERFVSVAPLNESKALKALDPEGLNGTNQLKLFVFGHNEEARLVALLDNLGKGASGAAVQNLNIALGLDESAGLT
jgi:N-acetyl-gamma-glutamyl-phosphate reductase